EALGSSKSRIDADKAEASHDDHRSSRHRHENLNGREGDAARRNERLEITNLARYEQVRQPGRNAIGEGPSTQARRFCPGFLTHQERQTLEKAKQCQDDDAVNEENRIEHRMVSYSSCRFGAKIFVGSARFCVASSSANFGRMPVDS